MFLTYGKIMVHEGDCGAQKGSWCTKGIVVYEESVTYIRKL